MKGYFDIQGDGGSDVIGQVTAKQAQIAAGLAGVRHRVAIGSGKGGVGKSTVTMQLAGALRAAGATVAILDADLNGPCQARLAGLAGVPMLPGEHGAIMPRSAAGIGVVSMGLAIPEPQSLEFDSVAVGDSYVWRATREFALLGDLLAGIAWGSLDFLLIDLPPGAERTVQYAEFLGPQTALVLVTTPSALSRGVVARSAAALRQVPNRVLGYVENMNGYLCGGCQSLQPLFPPGPALEVGAPCLGSVPYDPVLAAACDRGELLRVDEASPTWRAIRQVAEAIHAALEVR